VSQLEAGFWVAAAIATVYYTNFVRVMFTHKGVNQ
jgi:NADH:ubiquinone oxidoreductase subunit 2 (subunit N)